MKLNVSFQWKCRPEELAIMWEAFDSHCLVHGLVDENARSNVADLVMSLFQGGAIDGRAQATAVALIRLVEELLSPSRPRLPLRAQCEVFSPLGHRNAIASRQ